MKNHQKQRQLWLLRWCAVTSAEKQSGETLTWDNGQITNVIVAKSEKWARADSCHSANVQIDPSKLNITGLEVMQKLADTRPTGIGSMGTGASGMRGRDPDAPAGDNHSSHHGHPSDRHTFGFAVWQLKDGEDKIIADRLVAIFSAAPKA